MVLVPVHEGIGKKEGPVYGGRVTFMLARLSSSLLFPLRPYWYTGTTVLRTEYDAEEIQFGKKVAESFEVYTGERNVNDTSRS